MAFDKLDSDSSYDEDGPPLQPSTTRGGMKLRNAANIKRPARYNYDLEPVDPGRPIFVFADPVFNMDRAHFVQWRTLELDEPSPGEARHKTWQEQGEPRDAFGKPVVPSSPSRGDIDITSSPGPIVAHLRRRQFSSDRPDLSQALVNTVEQRDVFDEAFDSNMADFDDNESQSGGGDVSRVVHHKFSPQFNDWSALSENVQWAIIYDLAHDHQGGITNAVDLLSLNMAEVINFVNLYLREKALWETGALQRGNADSARALTQRDGAQDEDVPPVPDAEVDDTMRDFEPVQQDVATQMANDPEVGPQDLERVGDIWHETEEELFLEADNVAAEERVNQSDTINRPESVNRPGLQADEVQAFLEDTPPLVDLVTDRFSREDIASGRSYLNFVGLQEYADRFGEWLGSGASFREIPGIFDENNNLIFPTDDTNKALYSGNELNWEGPAPQPLEGPAQREWLMEALPQGVPRPGGPEALELQQFQVAGGRISGHPITPHGGGDMLLNHIPEGAQGGLDLVGPVHPGAFARIVADDEIADEEPANLVRKESEKGVRADSNAAQWYSKSYDKHGNLVYPGTPSAVLVQGAQLLNTSSALPNSPYMPRFDDDIVRRFPGPGNAVFDGGFNKHRSVPPSNLQPSHQLSAVSQPHRGIVQLAGRAAPLLSLPVHDSSQAKGTEQTTQAQTKDASIATPDSTGSPSIKAPSNHEARGSAKKVKRDAQVAVPPSEVQETTDSSRLSQNGIDTKGFPKCAPCFAARARCDGGRPCGSCSSRNRRCKDITKADLDKYPDRAERVIADQAKAEALLRSPASNPNAATPAPALSTAKTAGVKRKYSAIARDTSLGKDDSDLDQYPSEKEDSKDSDYDHTPKKKRPKKGSTPAVKKQVAAKEAPATSTSTKKGPRGPYKKKTRDSAVGSNEPGNEPKNTPPPQSSRSAPSRIAVAATKARKTSAKTPVPVKDKQCDLSLNAAEVNPSAAGAGRSVSNAVETVQQAAARMTNVRPVPVQKSSETRSVLDPSLIHPSLSGTEDRRYLDTPLAPVGLQTPPRMRPIPRPNAGLPGPGAYPSQGAYGMPGVPSNVMLSRHQTIARENNYLSGADFPSTASNPYDRTVMHNELPVTGEAMSVVPQIARPGLSGSPGPADVSPTSQSSGSGTTVSMDFLAMPFSPMQESPAYSHYSHGGMPGSKPRGSPGFSPGFPAGMVSLNSPTVPRRRLSGSWHNNGAPRQVTGVRSPLMAAAPGFAAAPGLMPPYTRFPDVRPIPRPVSRLQAGYGYQGAQQSVPTFRTSGTFHDHQGEEMRSGSRGVSASPSQHQQTTSPRPPKRMADASTNLGQQPARKKPRASNSPQAQPRQANSWQELARKEWANDSQANEPDAPHPSVKPLFGGDGSYEVSFSPFNQSGQSKKVQEQIDPVLKEMEIARKMSPPSAGSNKKR